MSSDTLREALEHLVKSLQRYAGKNGLGPHYMMIALTRAEAALSLPAEGPHEPMCDVFGKRCERCFPAKPETVAAPAQLGSCHRCDALWERNPAKMKHRHPEGTQFIYPCDAPPALLREGQEEARAIAHQCGDYNCSKSYHVAACDRATHAIEQAVKQARAEARSEAFSAASQRLQFVAHGYENGGHTHRAKMLRALATEFSALADLREKGGGV